MYYGMDTLLSSRVNQIESELYSKVIILVVVDYVMTIFQLINKLFTL